MTETSTRRRYRYVVGCHQCLWQANAQRNLVGILATEHLEIHPSHNVVVVAVEI